MDMMDLGLGIFVAQIFVAGAAVVGLLWWVFG